MKVKTASGNFKLGDYQPFDQQRVGVGEMLLVRNVRGKLWMENFEGEGMELNAVAEAKLEKLLCNFHEKHF